MDPTIGPGTVIAGDYRVVSPLAEGGMGAVYVVEQMSTARPRALKVLRSELLGAPGIADRFALEARVAARIRSEHVVEVIAAGWDPALQVPWLAMELLEGRSLDAILRERGRLTLPEASEVLRQVGAGLAAAHAAGVVHRDLKPENVFVSLTREATLGVRVKILDFGIAKLVAEAGAATSSTVAVGTPRWMSPEQTETQGMVTPASDVWALGLLTYYAITGKFFWRAAAGGPGASVGQLLREVLADPIPPASARAAEQGAAGLFPPSFDPWLARCIARDPRQRFPGAAEAMQALLPVLALGGPPSLSPAIVSGSAAAHPSPSGPQSFGGSAPATAVSSFVATGPTIPAPPTTQRKKRTGLWLGLSGGALALLLTTTVLVAHFQWGAFDDYLEEEVDYDELAMPLEGQWAIAEGRSPSNQSYSGEIGITRAGPIRYQRWVVSTGANVEGFGLVQYGKYFASWSTGPSGMFVYRIDGGRLAGRTISAGSSPTTDEESLQGPASLDGVFKIVHSSKGTQGTLTLKRDGPRWLATRTTGQGSFFGVALKDGSDLLVMVTTVGENVGAFVYRPDAKGAGLTGTWTDSTEPGLGREILARR